MSDPVEAAGGSGSPGLPGGSREGRADDAALRLRGGAAGGSWEERELPAQQASTSEASAIQVSAKVEVMNDDEGLRGCWCVPNR